MLCYSCSVSFKPENFDQLREGNLPARDIFHRQKECGARDIFHHQKECGARDIFPLPERVWKTLSSFTSQEK